MTKWKQWILETTGPGGVRSTSREDIIKAATAFYSSLYTSSKGDRWQGNILPPNVDGNNQTPPIIQSEVRVAIKELKTGRTPGEEHIHKEHLKQCLEHLLEQLITIFNTILHTEEITNYWKLSKIIILHKKVPKMIYKTTDQ